MLCLELLMGEVTMKRVITVKACVEPSTVLNTQRKDGEEKSEVGANTFQSNSRSCRLEPPYLGSSSRLPICGKLCRVGPEKVYESTPFKELPSLNIKDIVHRSTSNHQVRPQSPSRALSYPTTPSFKFIPQAFHQLHRQSSFQFFVP